MDSTPSYPENNSLRKIARFLISLVEKPVIWFRETVVLPNRQEYPWYHEQFRRVPTVDECYCDDIVCIREADEQFRRDRLVDSEILNILIRRYDNCSLYHSPHDKDICLPLLETYKNAELNFFIKYGDIGTHAGAKDAFMKQKHRMIWERRQASGNITGKPKAKEEPVC